MSIDDKAIGHEGITIMSTAETGKIALMVESCKARKLQMPSACSQEIWTKYRASAVIWLQVFKRIVPSSAKSQRGYRKFHVMQHVYDAVLDVRSNLKKKLAERLSKGKSKTAEDVKSKKNRCVKALPLPLHSRPTNGAKRAKKSWRKPLPLTKSCKTA